MKKILVINNDVDTMSLLQNWLQKKNYTVKFTGNPSEVPKLIKKFGPKLLIIDILQKDVITQIRNDERFNEVPVILMTGYSYRQKADLPVDDFIEKPFNLSLFEKKIEKLIL